ncbi:MAG: hypothetical protein ACYC63_16340 [Armatimonadota bacterium]
MDNLTLPDVARLARFVCALCGKRLTVHELEQHAAAHARRGECLNYKRFARESDRRPSLEGMPCTIDSGEEVVWPYELVQHSFQERHRQERRKAKRPVELTPA